MYTVIIILVFAEMSRSKKSMVIIHAFTYITVLLNFVMYIYPVFID